MSGSFAAGLLLAGALCAPAAALTVALDDADPATLDPHRQFAYRNHILCQQLFDGLVRFDPEGRIEPALAESWERIGPERMRFKLRRGVRFHDGEPFDAESVRFSIARYLDPATGFPARGFLSTLAGAEVVDPRTVDIVTKGPDGLLLNRLAGFILIVPPRRLKDGGEAEFSRKPVGTGAFRFVSWEPGHAVRLERNPDYWMAGYPKSDALVFRFLPADKRIPALLSGEVDLIWEVPGTRTLEIESDPRTRVLKGETLFTIFCGVNYSTGPLADIRVRRALNAALDRRDLIRYDLLGNGEVLASSTMPGEGGHEPKLKPYAHDPELARRLLREAGYGGGLRLKTIVNVNARRAAGIIAAQLARVGVELATETVTEAEFGRFAQARFDLSIGGSPDPMAHAYFIQSIILHSGSPFSLAKDPEFDARLERMAATLDPAERDRLARDIDALIHERHYGLPTYQRLQVYGLHKDLKYRHYITGMPHFFAAYEEGSNP